MNKAQKNLKAARAKIEAILKQHDIAGFVTLHCAPDQGEVFWNLWPSYSIIVGDFPAVRVVSNPAKYGGNLEKMNYDQAQTANMMMHLATSMGGCAMQFLELSGAIDAKLGAEHGQTKFEPDPGKNDPGMH